MQKTKLIHIQRLHKVTQTLMQKTQTIALVINTHVILIRIKRHSWSQRMKHLALMVSHYQHNSAL